MAFPTDQELLSSGEFAKRSRLSPKALRIYAETGLLRPVDIDPSNGYRSYSAGQVRTARLIGLLRGVDMSLAEISGLLSEIDRFPERAIERLDAHLAQLEAAHTSRRSLVRHIHAVLREETCPMFTVQTRHVPAMRVMSVQRRVRLGETDAFVRQAKHHFADLLQDRPALGPFSLIFHGIVDADNDGPLEATVGCPDDVQPTDLVGIRTEPAHDEAFTTITKAQWDYPAILAAYDAVACSAEVADRSGTRLSCREVYLAEPGAIGNDDLICDIAFPLGEEPVP